MSSEDDCNSLGLGVYLCNSSVKNILLANWCAIVSATVDGTAVQIAYILGSDKVYRRCCAAGSWSQWENTYPIKLIEIRLHYKSATEMYGESNVSGISLGQFVANCNGTSWSAVNYAITGSVK